FSVPNGSFHLFKSVGLEAPYKMYFSPDGRWLGYDQAGNSAATESDILVMASDGSTDVHLIEHQGRNEMVGWSPDGKWLLYSSDRTGSRDLWALPFSDGKSQGPSQLLKTGFDRSWSV